MQGVSPICPSRVGVGVGDGSLEAREVFGRHTVLDVHQRWAFMMEANGTVCPGL